MVTGSNTAHHLFLFFHSSMKITPNLYTLCNVNYWKTFLSNIYYITTNITGNDRYSYKKIKNLRTAYVFI